MPGDMKSKIADVLNDMLKHKNLDKITVKELVDACNISRQSFYYHFRDIMDVVEWYQNKALSSGAAGNVCIPAVFMVYRRVEHV